MKRIPEAEYVALCDQARVMTQLFIGLVGRRTLVTVQHLEGVVLATVKRMAFAHQVETVAEAQDAPGYMVEKTTRYLFDDRLRVEDQICDLVRIGMETV